MHKFPIETAKLIFIHRSGYATHDDWERGLIGRILRHTPAVYTQRVGEITSPRYPLKMTNKVFNHCLWTIEVCVRLGIKLIAFFAKISSEMKYHIL